MREFVLCFIYPEYPVFPDHYSEGALRNLVHQVQFAYSTSLIFMSPLHIEKM